VHGDICTLCCGNEREVSVDCPIDCEYLPGVNPDEFPNKDIKVTEDFLKDNPDLLVYVARALLAAAIETPGASDADVREALDALIRTYRTAESGLIYETRSPNPYAEAVRQRWNESIEKLRAEMREATGMYSIRDSEVLGMLVFLQRVSIQHNNGRRRGKAFLSFLLDHFPQTATRIATG
jgi:hypothetical protein